MHCKGQGSQDPSTHMYTYIQHILMYICITSARIPSTDSTVGLCTQAKILYSAVEGNLPEGGH